MKETWLNEKCTEIEELAKFRSDKMYKIINEFNNKNRYYTNGNIKDKNGNILFKQKKN